MMGSMMRRAMIGDSATLNVDFTSMTNGGQLANAGFTFTNATTTARTYINSNGVLATATTNEPRFDHDPTTLAPRGLLIEGTATNLALNSETFPTSGTGMWAYEDVTANATKITAPDGTANAIQFNETTANNVHRIGHSVSGSAGAVSVSVWVKVLQPGTPRRLFINANTFMNARGLFDIDPAVQTGASGTAVSVTGTAANRAGTWIKYPNDWYRCTLIGTYSTASTVYFQINRASSSTATDDIFAGSTTNGLAIWGAQVEAGSGASSYIPTGASQVQRLADSAVMNDIGPLNYSATNGSIYWSGIINKQPTSYITLVGFMTAIDQPAYETFGNALNYFTAARGPTLNIGGSNEVSRPYVLGSLIKYASSVNTLQDPIVAVNLNGSASSTNKAGTGDLRVATRFVIGRQPSSTYGAEYPSVTIRSIKYWPTSKVAAELAALTA